MHLWVWEEFQGNRQASLNYLFLWIWRVCKWLL